MTSPRSCRQHKSISPPAITKPRCRGSTESQAPLDREDADELVQQTVPEAISAGGTLDLGDLGDRLAHTAAEQNGQATESLNEDGNGSHVYDPDSEPGELFYPDFYHEGPDEGR